MLARFKYGPRLTAHLIRLIRVHPKDADQILKCDIVTSDLDDDVEYNALSYVWGDSTLRKELILNKQKAEITDSLHGALMRYKSSRHTPLLWADAICISLDRYLTEHCRNLGGSVLAFIQTKTGALPPDLNLSTSLILATHSAEVDL